ncbi:MAG: DPP IV N-terminal domain-containing protein [Dehalococcoidia bacterium]
MPRIGLALGFIATLFCVTFVSGPARVSAGGPTPPLDGAIVFVSDRDGDFELYLTGRFLDGDVQLTHNATNDDDPDWSPDGTKIAFMRASNIWVMNADGTGEVQLTSMGRDSQPAWSPNGLRIAFMRELAGGNREVLVMFDDGSGVINLSNSPGNDFSPDWSPDGMKIVFDTSRDGNREIYTMFANGSGQTNITDNPGNDADASWALAGFRIAFASDRTGNTELYSMETDGGDVRQLTDDSAFDGEPSFAPSGIGIVFRSNRDGNEEIYGLSPVGPYRITDNPAFERAPDVQPVSNAGPGDTSCDKRVDAIDASIVLQYDANLIEGTYCIVNGHMNDDSFINSIDAVIMLQFVAGLIDHIPVS